MRCLMKLALLSIVFFTFFECCAKVNAREVMCTEERCMQYEQNINEVSCYEEVQSCTFVNTNEMGGGEIKFSIVTNIIAVGIHIQEPAFLETLQH